MKDLLARLEAAEAGSRELDKAIHKIVTGMKVIQRTPAGWCSHYTTSLDAALPGENIISSNEIETGRWEAVHCGTG